MTSFITTDLDRETAIIKETDSPKPEWAFPEYEDVNELARVINTYDHSCCWLITLKIGRPATVTLSSWDVEITNEDNDGQYMMPIDSFVIEA